MPFRVLLAEDNQADADLLAECVEDWKRPVKLMHVLDGQQAIEQLRQRPVPDLVLLDLNMPLRGGLEVLEEMKNDPKLRLIPVIILTSSAAPSDIRAAYERHANTFFQKPMDIDDYQDLLKLIEIYWSQRAQRPRL